MVACAALASVHDNCACYCLTVNEFSQLRTKCLPAKRVNRKTETRAGVISDASGAQAPVSAKRPVQVCPKRINAKLENWKLTTLAVNCYPGNLVARSRS